MCWLMRLAKAALAKQVFVFIHGIVVLCVGTVVGWVGWLLMEAAPVEWMQLLSLLVVVELSNSDSPTVQQLRLQVVETLRTTSMEFLVFSDQVLLIFHFDFFLVSQSKRTTATNCAPTSKPNATNHKPHTTHHKHTRSQPTLNPSKWDHLSHTGTTTCMHACMPTSNTVAACWRRLC
jgi:hypothetical protein